MEAVCRLTDRMLTRGGRRRAGLRDAALLILLAAGLTKREVLHLRGRDVQQTEDGQLYVWVVSPSGTRRPQRLRVRGASEEYVHARLLEYLEHEHLWGQERPLFAGRGGHRPLAASAIRMIERKHRGRR